MTDTYKVVRFYQSGHKRVIKSGLPLSLAQEHCSDKNTSSRTCTAAWAKRITRRCGRWFDGYTREG